MPQKEKAAPIVPLIEWNCARFKIAKLLIEAKASGISAAQARPPYPGCV